MTDKPAIIGITTYAQNEKREFTLPEQYVQSVRRGGGIPLLIAPGEGRLAELMHLMDGLVLAGGGDIDPELSGGEPHETVYNVDATRDRMELTLARAAIDAGLPTLAICRGLQIVNIALGGTLHSHLPVTFGDRVQHREPPREPVPHDIEVDAPSNLHRILGARYCRPMSWHHQGIRQVAEGLQIVARAPDGVIEAVELASHPWLIGVQWHPELTADEDPAQQRLFDALVEVARNGA